MRLVINVYIYTDRTSDTHRRSSMFALTYTINALDGHLQSRSIPAGLAPIAASLVAPPILPGCSATPPGPVETYQPFLLCPISRLSPRAHGVSCGLLCICSIPATSRCPGTPSAVDIASHHVSGTIPAKPPAPQAFVPISLHPYQYGTLPPLVTLGASETYLNRVHLWALPSLHLTLARIDCHVILSHQLRRLNMRNDSASPIHTTLTLITHPLVVFLFL